MKKRVQLMGCGTILREVEAAAQLLQEEWGVAADIWSVTSANQLRRDGLACQRWNLLNPEAESKVPYLTQQLEGAVGPVIAASDYMKTYFDQLRPFIPSAFRVLGADGFGRSDTRDKLRHFFEVNRYFVVVAALSALVEQGSVKPATVATALKKYGISADKLDPSLI